MAGDDDDATRDEDRGAILARRSRLIALAFSGLTGAAGCYESHAVGEPPRPGVDAGRDAAVPGPCLEAPLDAGAVPCLGVPAPDAAPTPCLDVAPEDAGSPIVDASPTPCLEPPADAGPDATPGPCLSFRPED